ncbi:hypothetical protein HOA92_03530 [archaeon]|jgi:hypothetical protein|nr:hypothetical protein [archaeon]MBT6762083.1 hypothetical protein [archaeon]
MKPYFATTGYSTVASSVLTIVHFLNEEVSLTREEEFKIWQQTTILPTRASSIFALAKYAKEKGCTVKVIVEKEEYDFPDYRFYRYTKEDVDNAKLSAKLLRQDAIGAGINMEVKDFTLNDVDKELLDNKIILLRLNVKALRNMKRNSSNYVVINNYNKQTSEYSIIDCGDTARSVTKEILQECFDTLESKKHRDHRMLIFER